MPRSARLWEPGDLLSVVVRAHEGRPIFAGDDDRGFFVDRLRRVFVATDVDLLAWALLVNHFHLLIRVTRLPPERLFRRLGTALGLRERRLRGDHGAVLQGRYWSRPCRDESSVLSALTYVLGNPVHHGVVPSAAALESYAWTATPEVLGCASPGLVDATKTLGLVHPDPETARASLRVALADRVARWKSQRAGFDLCEEPGCRGEPDGCLLVHPRRVRTFRTDGGDAAPPVASSIAGIATIHDEQFDRQARLRLRGWRPADLVGPVCLRLGATPTALLDGSHRPPECAARAAIAHVACDGAGVLGAEIAELLRVSDSAVTRARVRGARVLSEHGWSVDEVLSWPAVPG